MSAKRTPPPRPDPLAAALEVLERFQAGKGLLDRLTDDSFARRPDLTRNERSLVTALSAGAVRHLGRVDFVLSALSSTPLAKIQPRVLSILRLGVFQLLFTDRPAPLVVDGCVRQVGAKAPAWLTGFVNGLLRAVARKGRDVALPDFGREPAAHLAAALSCPEWLAQRRVARLGPEEARRLCEADNRVPGITTRENPLAPGFSDLAPLLADHVQDLVPGRYVPGAWSFSRPDAPLDELEAHRKGFFTVQDEGSQFVSLLLSPLPGERILDACAGMGVKTGHLVQLMGNRGTVVGADVDAGKLRVLEREMARIGAAIAAIRLVQPGTGFLLPGDEPFHRVLVDAPCSGLGALRRHPDAKWLKSGADIPRQAQNQAEILSQAAGALAPGGTLVYAVCSLEPEENEEVAAGFLRAHPEFSLADPASLLPDPARDMAGPDGFFRAWPHVHGTDGFFAAVFRRRP